MKPAIEPSPIVHFRPKSGPKKGVLITMPRQYLTEWSSDNPGVAIQFVEPPVRKLPKVPKNWEPIIAIFGGR